jgi:hypothetical protein
MKKLISVTLIFLFGLFISSLFAQTTSSVQLTFHIDGSANDELKPGIMYSWDELVAIKEKKGDINRSPEIASTHFLSCPDNLGNTCTVMVEVCFNPGFTGVVTYGAAAEGDAICGGLFDGNNLENQEELICTFELEDLPITNTLRPSCENEVVDNCISLYLFSTGTSSCSAGVSLSYEMQDMEPCITRDELKESFPCVLPAPIPTLNQWSILILIILIMVVGITVLRKRMSSIFS